ncbi:putative Dynactin subunit 4 [Yasminevirus sp. GU-2018]|uniref:Putative Dynactin subunit 4 n=1 Tax=Yasminevirus sp. GU-2018 TaxID=2420051 RepID=A0A5K0UB75_9VIRU|nr:putative Dynactin subunit 4 [Yasminevirus sp. GU-2018]
MNTLKISKKESEKQGSALFIDMVDPDNFLTALLFAVKCFNNRCVAYIVCTGRPVSYKLSRFNPKTTPPSFRDCDSNQPVPMDFKVHVRESHREKFYQNEQDAIHLLQVNMAMLNFLLKKDLAPDVYGNVHLVNGGIAPVAGLSHAIHDYEDLFPIIVNTGGDKPALTYRTPEEYMELVEKLDAMSPNDRAQFRRALTHEQYLLVGGPFFKTYYMHNVTADLEQNDFNTFYVGGPCTGIAQILNYREAPILRKPFHVYAMMGSLPGDVNLLGDNFNIKTDWKAFDSVFMNVLNDHHRNVTFYPTGVCKQGWLNFTTDSLEFTGFKHFLQLHRLWTGIKGNRPQPMFDVTVLFAPEKIPFKSVSLKPILGVLPDGSERCDLVTPIEVSDGICVFTTNSDRSPPTTEDGIHLIRDIMTA